MTIDDKNFKSLGTSADMDLHITPKIKRNKNTKLLVISENNSDIYMLKKILSKVDGYIIHEASSLSSALKVMHYLKLNLIIVDDNLSELDGYEVVEKLNKIKITKDIPKIIMLTDSYKTEKIESLAGDNIDFVKKPLDSLIVQLRVNNLIKNSDKKLDRKNHFQHLARQKFEESNALMAIYQNIFEYSESMMCIYDATNKTIVESNAIFEKFFLPINIFNRILSNPRYVRKFVPYIEEANYLNYYNPKEWMQTLIEGGDFSYLIKFQRDYKEYSFTIFVKQLLDENSSLYSIRLSNIYDYLPHKNAKNRDSKLHLKERNYEVFKDDFIKLRESIHHENIENDEITKLLYQLSVKLSIVSEDASLISEVGKEQKINVFSVLLELCVEKFNHKIIYINDLKVTKLLDRNSEMVYSTLNSTALYDLIYSLLSHYYGSHFSSEVEHPRVDITLSQKSTSITITITLNELDNSTNQTSLVERIFRKNTPVDNDDIAGILPKNAKNSLSLLNASIQKKDEHTCSIFTITIPV